MLARFDSITRAQREESPSRCGTGAHPSGVGAPVGMGVGIIPTPSDNSRAGKTPAKRGLARN
jgi:hypothetical protein